MPRKAMAPDDPARKVNIRWTEDEDAILIAGLTSGLMYREICEQLPRRSPRVAGLRAMYLGIRPRRMPPPEDMTEAQKIAAARELRDRIFEVFLPEGIAA